MSVRNVGGTWITTALVTALACLASTTASAQTTLSGEVLAPSDSSHYEFVILTAAMNVSGATVTATASWASDWYLPPPIQHTSSFPNLVEMPYLGGFGCDFIRNYPQNNFVEFQSGMDPTNPSSTKTASITVGPGKAVAIAGSDCFFGDNFTFHTLVKWTVQLQACQVSVPPPPIGSRWYQLDPTWAGDHYDNANPPQNTIGDQGCALTALAAVLGTVGVSIDPGSLNTILDGYPGVYSPPSPNVPNSGGRIDFPSAVTDIGAGALWFDVGQKGLDSYLCAQRPKPVIVQVTNSSTGHQHYVVVTGKNATGYSIIDPGYQYVNSLSTYGNQFTVTGVVKKTSGDPSALALVVVDTATLLVTAPDGSQTGFDPVSGQVLKGSTQSAYFEQNNSIDTDTESVAPTSVTYSVDYSFPQDGAYSVRLIGLKSGTYQLSINAFDVNGAHEGYFVKPGVTSFGSISTFQLQYSSASGGSTSVARFATFPSALADISNSLQLGLIDNAGIANALSSKINAASDAATGGDGKTASNVLNAFKNQVSAQTDKHITGVAPQVLQEDADSLISQLH